MQTPFDWQQAIGLRGSYVQSRLSAAAPLFMVSHKDGIVAYTARRQARKIYEIYDRLLIGATGQQSDVESLRIASIDYTHREGFNRSEADVSIARVISAMSASLKTNFSDFNSTPYVVQAVFSEIADDQQDDVFYLLDYDGDYSVHKRVAYLLPGETNGIDVRKKLLALQSQHFSVEELANNLRLLWIEVLAGSDKLKLPVGLVDEAVLMARDQCHITRIREISV